VPLILQAGNPEFEAQLIKAGKELPTIAGFALTPALAMFIMTWDNIVNIFVQPWVGARSDRTWTKIGRRKPWILIGCQSRCSDSFPFPWPRPCWHWPSLS
jgi:hypothetical protein